MGCGASSESKQEQKKRAYREESKQPPQKKEQQPQSQDQPQSKQQSHETTTSGGGDGGGGGGKSGDAPPEKASDKLGFWGGDDAAEDGEVTATNTDAMVAFTDAEAAERADIDDTAARAFDDIAVQFSMTAPLEKPSLPVQEGHGQQDVHGEAPDASGGQSSMFMVEPSGAYDQCYKRMAMLSLDASNPPSRSAVSPDDEKRREAAAARALADALLAALQDDEAEAREVVSVSERAVFAELGGDAAKERAEIAATAEAEQAAAAKARQQREEEERAERSRREAAAVAEAEAAAAAARKDRLEAQMREAMAGRAPTAGPSGSPPPEEPSRPGTSALQRRHQGRRASVAGGPRAAKSTAESHGLARRRSTAAVAIPDENETKSGGDVAIATFCRAKYVKQAADVREFESELAQQLADYATFAEARADSASGDTKYVMRGPVFTGASATAAVRTTSTLMNNQVHSFVLADGTRWYYNDTPDKAVKVTATASASNGVLKATALPDATVITDSGTELKAEVLAGPGETKGLVSFAAGKIGFGFSCGPVGAEYREQQQKSSEAAVAAFATAIDASGVTAAAAAVVSEQAPAGADMAVLKAVHAKDFVAAKRFKSNGGDGNSGVIEASCFRDARDAAAAVECAKAGCVFVDATFSPGLDSVGSVNTAARHGVGWQRPAEFLPPPIKPKACAIEVVDPEDVCQGQLGNCYFCCSMSAIAEFPFLVHRCFPLERGAGMRIPATGLGGATSTLTAQAATTAGALVVRLCCGGWWRDVVIDAFLPVAGAAPVFAHNDGAKYEFWASYLEKAFAKVRGQYGAVVGGTPMDALNLLTGAPTVSLNFRGEKGDEAYLNTLFADLALWDNAAFCISASIDGGPSKEWVREEGLVPNHAFTVLSAVAVPKDATAATAWTKREEARADRWRSGAAGLDIEPEVPTGTDTTWWRLVQVRNPWGGAKEWTGAWSDGSDCWQKHPHVADAVGFDGPSDDGCFWMDIADFVRYFDSGTVCCVHRRWDDYRLAVDLRPESVGSAAVELTVAKETEIVCSLSLPTSDGRGANRPATAIKLMSIHDPSAKVSEASIVSFSSNTGAASTGSKAEKNVRFAFVAGVAPSLRATLEPGTYLLTPVMAGNCEGTHEAVLSLQTLVPFADCLADGLPHHTARFVDLHKTEEAMANGSMLSKYNAQGGRYSAAVAVDAADHLWQLRRGDGALESGCGPHWPM